MFSSNLFKRYSAVFCLVALPAVANAQEYRFSIHHFLSPKAPAQKVLLEPWVKAVEKASSGRIVFEIFPAMSLGGRPSELYSQVRDGAADLVWTLTGYTPGTFPRIEVFELPSVHGGDARATNLAIQDLMPQIAGDLADVHPILVHVHTGNALHLAKGRVEAVKDFEGLKVRSPSRTGAWMLEKLKAEPVGMPVPALPQALSKRTIDAGLVPFEVAIPLGLSELTKASVELHGGSRFGTATFLFAMNKSSYNSLPDDLKKVIDENSGVELAESMGKAWNSIEPIGIGKVREAGNLLITISEKDSRAFEPVFDAVAERWVTEVNKKGINGSDLLSKAKKAVKYHSH